MKRLIIIAAALAVTTSAYAQTQVKYVKYQAGNRTAWGILENETTIREISAAPWDGAKPTGRTARLAEVKLMAPAEAKKVIAAGLNYKSHIGQASPAKYVGLFAKFPTSLIGHEGDIIYPADATTVHYEAEICVVMGKKAKNITEAQVKDHIFGVTACNDVSERAWQKSDRTLWRAKNTDTFKPMGPWIETDLKLDDNLITTVHVNGKESLRYHTN
ncbi:MAG TPA: fumarylacetoacetate hydrolase family protein, partial [Vicinamibacterales bacterium]|nr:fumarylacetoacetate hydrolase family protein [Vicinamibacterales bacterium]